MYNKLSIKLGGNKMETMEKDQSCKNRVRSHYSNRMDDLKKLWKLYNDGNEEGDPDLGTFGEYGLSFDYVPSGTFRDQRIGYFRYQLSYGGPSEEFRFYCDGQKNLYKAEFWFLDWFDGARVTITQGKNFDFLNEIFSFFDEMGTLDSEMEKAKD